MSLYILNDKNIPVFVGGRAQKEITSLKALNQKRIPTKVIDDINDMSVLLTDPEAVLLIPFSLNESMDKALFYGNSNHIPIIAVHSAPYFAPQYIYSSIHESRQMMSSLLLYLLKYGKRKIAFFGMNSANDDYYKVLDLYNIYSDFSSDDIFFLEKTFNSLYDKFIPRMYDYDAIICPNDFMAISLMKKFKNIDPDYFKKHFLIGFMDTFVSKFYHTPLTSITYSNEAVLKAVASMYRLLNQRRDIYHSIDMRISNIFRIRSSTQNLPIDNFPTFFPSIASKRPPLAFPKDIKDIYHNDELSIIIRIENMFENSTNLDFQIIYLFLIGKSNSDIRKKLLISNQTLLYHSSFLFKSLNVDTKQEFLDIVSQYVNSKNLKHYMDENIK